MIKTPLSSSISTLPPDAAEAQFIRTRRLRGIALAMLGLVAVALCVAILVSELHSPARRMATSKVAQNVKPPIESPSVDRAEMLSVSAEDAEQINATIPLSTAPNPAAQGFAATLNGLDFTRATECLTAAVYYEAASEPLDGQRAVAQVVLNRVRHPAFPHNVCGVVFQGAARKTGCQFSFTCDGSLLRKPSTAGWARARSVAIAALSGAVYAPVGWATHYHADYVVPKWARELGKTTSVGRHIFYRWNDGWGRPAAYRMAYAGAEMLDAWSMAVAAAPQFALAETSTVPVPAVIDPALAAVSRVPLRDMAGAAGNAQPAPIAPERWAIRGQTAPAAQATPAPAASPSPSSAP